MTQSINTANALILLGRNTLPWARDRLSDLQARGVRTDLGHAYLAQLHAAIDLAETRIGQSPEEATL